jgi:hypothetical protein
MSRIALDEETDHPLVIIPPSRSMANNVYTPEQARRILDATHALQITLRREGRDLLARARSSSWPHKHASRKSPAAIRRRTWAICPPRSRGGVQCPAFAGSRRGTDIDSGRCSYLEGLFYLRRDQHSFDEAIPLFRKAAALDPHSPLPPAGLVEALVLKYQSGKELRWLDEADRALQTARALNPDSVAVLLAGGRLELSRAVITRRH